MMFGRPFSFALFSLGLSACGGAQPAPAPAGPPSAVLVVDADEPADRSPVAAPPELFLVGRVARPFELADELGAWSGVPLGPGLRAVLAEELEGMDSLMAVDAPLEFAAALPTRGKRHDPDVVVSFGVTSVDATVRAARGRGQELRKLGAQIYGGVRLGSAHCIVGPARGAAPARVVCGDRLAQVERLFPYASRGLPDEKLGDGELEVVLNAEPLRRRFDSELAGARLLAGFLIRQLELDSPRFDRALSDAVYGLADELLAIAEDAESARLSGKLRKEQRTLELELSLELRSDKSWLAKLGKDLAARNGPPPPAFGRLPAEAGQASFATGVREEHFAPARKAALELLDAYLEHEKVPKRLREHAKALVSGYFALARGGVYAKGSLGSRSVSGRADWLAPDGWSVGRIEVPVAEVEATLAALRGVLGERELYRLVQAKIEAKDVPKATLGPLRERGAPKGARVFALTLPAGLLRSLAEADGGSSRTAKSQSYALVFVEDRGGTAYAWSSDAKDASLRLSGFLGEGGERIATRPALAGLFSTPSVGAGFLTLAAILESLPPERADALADRAAGLPGRGAAPVLMFGTAQRGPPLTLSVRVDVPAAFIGDLPGLARDWPLELR